MRRFALTLLVCALAGCGGDGGSPEPAARETPAAQPRAEGIDAVAERTMEEIPGCTPDETQKVSPEWRKEGVVAIRTGFCEDEILERLAIFEFEAGKAAEKHRQNYSLIDDPRARNGEIVVNGNIFCHEEFRRRKDSVSCSLVVGPYILLAGGRRGVETSDVMDDRMSAFARAAE